MQIHLIPLMLMRHDLWRRTNQLTSKKSERGYRSMQNDLFANDVYLLYMISLQCNYVFSAILPLFVSPHSTWAYSNSTSIVVHNVIKCCMMAFHWFCSLITASTIRSSNELRLSSLTIHVASPTRQDTVLSYVIHSYGLILRILYEIL